MTADRKKLLVLPKLQTFQQERIRQIAEGWDVIFGSRGLSEDEAREVEVAAGWNRWLAEHALRPGSRLRWVQNWGAGVDHMPLREMEKKGILLTNASGVHAYPISETVMAMMLSFTRKLHLSVRSQVEKKWTNLGTLPEMHEQTAGIIGVGAIGQEIARLCKAFGMRVLGVRKSGEAAPYVDEMYDSDGLDEMLTLSDYVIMTLPLTEQTRYLMNRARFGLMKPTAFYVNIGRGGTTDTEALIEALQSGTIAGAGLDVFEEEPLPDASPLWDLPNVIITPHNSGSSVHYDDRAMDIFAENLRDYVAGREPRRNRVNLADEY